MLISASDIIKESWLLYQKNWKKLAPYLLLLFVPTLILTVLGALSIFLSENLPSTTLISSIIVALVFAASLVFVLWVSISLATVMRHILHGQLTRSWSQIMSATSPLIWPLIYTSILVGLIVLGGTILLIIPGIIFSIWYSFAIYAVIFEDQKGTTALRLSKSLVVGRWWAIFWRLLAPSVVFMILLLAVSIIVSYIIKIIPMSPELKLIILRLIDAILNTIITPLTAGAGLILYLNAKQNPLVADAPQTPPQA